MGRSPLYSANLGLCKCRATAMTIATDKLIIRIPTGFDSWIDRTPTARKKDTIRKIHTLTADTGSLVLVVSDMATVIGVAIDTT